MKKILILNLIIAVFIVSGCAKKNETQNVKPAEKTAVQSKTTQSSIGNDKDEHGCINSAGYSWCEAKQKCLRSWEEKCEAVVADKTADWKIYNNENYKINFKYPRNYNINEATDSDNNTKRKFLGFIENQDNRFLSFEIYERNLDYWLSQQIEIGRGCAFNIGPCVREKLADAYKIDNIKIDNKDAIRYEEAPCDETGCAKQKNIIIVVENNNLIYVFDISNIFRDLTTTFLNTISIENNILLFDKIKVGDAINGLTIKSINPFDKSYDNGKISEENLKIVFSGEIEISGKYKIEKGEMFNGRAYFYLTEPDRILPKIGKLTNHFYFDNQDSAIKLLGTNDIDATIIISDYVINSYPSEVSNTAKLIKVINKK